MFAQLLQCFDMPWETLRVHAAEVYLRIDPRSVKKPKFVFNLSLGEACPWRHVPVRIVPPACLDRTAPTGAVTVQVTGEDEDVVRAAIRNKTTLSVPQINSIMSALHIDRPKPKTGSGKNGSICKIDLLRCLVNHLFPDLSAREREDLASGLVAKRQKGTLEEAPDLLLQLTAAVGEREAQHFKKIQESAVEELEVREEKRKLTKKHKDAVAEPAIVDSEDEGGPGPAQGAAEPMHAPAGPPAAGPMEVDDGSVAPPPGPSAGVVRAVRAPNEANAPHATRTKAPPELLELIPSVPYLYLKWQPQHRRVQAEFTRSLAEF